ncbi:MAG: hypothetical protein ACF8NJ_10725 [Phycisphaerales bacterium JB038]
MDLFKALFGGLIGAAIGAGIWAAIAHYGNYEIGIVAWGIGVLAGVGVRLGAGERLTGTTGALAVLIAVIGIAVGKYSAVSLAFGATVRTQTPEDAVSGLAQQIVYERELEGGRVRFPSGVDPEMAWGESDFPDPIWREAEARYEQLPASAQDELQSYPFLANPDYVISYVADDIAAEWEDEGRQLDWPALEMDREPAYAEDYPPAVWQEALDQWEAMTDTERRDFKQDVLAYEDAMYERYVQDVGAQVKWQAFLASFSIFDLLWVFLAVASAWKLGTGEAQSIGEA